MTRHFEMKYVVRKSSLFPMCILSLTLVELSSSLFIIKGEIYMVKGTILFYFLYHFFDFIRHRFAKNIFPDSCSHILCFIIPLKFFPFPNILNIPHLSHPFNLSPLTQLFDIFFSISCATVFVCACVLVSNAI